MVSRELVSNALAIVQRPIRVGFLGHRSDQLPEECAARVRVGVDAALDALQAAGKEAAHRRIKFVLVNELADGADRIAAKAALSRGWALEVPLPFSVERFEQDFPDAVGEFQTLLRRAAKVRPMPKNDDDPEAGYVAAGRAVIKGADAVLIVWNGNAGRGAGGTADMAGRALAGGAPVVWVGVADAPRIRLLLPERARRGYRAAYMTGALAARIERAERPQTLAAEPVN